jgi:hypothetical protein
MATISGNKHREAMLKAIWTALNEGACTHCIAYDLVDIAACVLDQHDAHEQAEKLWKVVSDFGHKHEGDNVSGANFAP